MRIIQIQPTLRCNLRCSHCYSESGQVATDEIPAAKFENFLRQAKLLGYDYVGVSGGEPLLWNDLNLFLDLALKLGFSTSIITNGTLLTAERAAGLRGRARLVAVSVEGPPDDHDKIRGVGSFEAMSNGITALKAEKVPFILVFTLTRHNADRLSWLYDFADKVGAGAVEVHPLAAVGAASKNLSGSVPDSIEFKVAARLLALLSFHRGIGGPATIFDVIKRDIVKQSSWAMLSTDKSALTSASFSDLVPSLVVEPSGDIVPFIYGFPHKWAIGLIENESLEDSTTQWRTRYAEEISNLICATIKRLANAEYIDLFGELLETVRLYENPS